MEFPVIWKKIKIQQKYAFLSTFIIGIICHGTVLFNKFSYFDDAKYFYTGGVTFTSGRWMLFITEKLNNMVFLDNIYSLSAINGFFTILCIAGCACLLIDLFHIRSVNFSILLGGIMISIPVITSMFGFMFNAQFYALAIFFAVAGTWLILKKNKWYTLIIGIILLTCSIGIYQAYIPMILCIFLFGLFQYISDADCGKNPVPIIKKSVIVFFSCIAFVLLYLGINNFVLKIKGLQLSDFKGMNSYNKIGFDVYLFRIRTAYHTFFRPYQNSPYNIFPSSSRTIYMIILFFTGLLLLTHIVRIFRKNSMNAVFLILISLLIPLCVNFIFVMVDIQYCYSMMFYANAVFFIFFLWLFERNIVSGKAILSKVLFAAANFLMGILVLIYARYDNACYTRMALMQTQLTRYYSSLVTRMQNEPGYRQDMRVAYIGKPVVAKWDPTMPEDNQFDFITTSPYEGFTEYVGNGWKEYMRLWFEFQPREADAEYFTGLPEVLDMPHFPDAGSIKVIDDTLVVKF